MIGNIVFQCLSGGSVEYIAAFREEVNSRIDESGEASHAFPLTTQPGYQIFPCECHEGNLMVIQVLSGARAEERADAEAVGKGLPVPPRSRFGRLPKACGFLADAPQLSLSSNLARVRAQL